MYISLKDMSAAVPNFGARFPLDFHYRTIRQEPTYLIIASNKTN